VNKRLRIPLKRFVAVTGWLAIAASPALAQFGGVDSTFKPGSGNSAGFDFDVLAVAVQSDGKIIAGGAFSQDGHTSRNGVARLNSDGTLDMSFDPGLGANNTVQALALQPDGKVVIAGRFTAVNGATHNYVARLNSNGSVDGSFSPQADDLAVAVAVQPDGTILLGGAFTTINGIPRNYIARLNANGSLDSGFVPATITDNATFKPSLQSLSVRADGRIVIGGQFTDVGGLSRNRIARLNADGSLDATFDPGIGANKTVNSLAMQADGKIIAGGDFTNIVGATRFYVARLNTGGSVDTTFNPGIGLAFGGVITVGVEVDGKILVGGDFAAVDGVGRNDIARLNADGSLDQSFDPGSGPATPNEVPRVRAIVVQPDGKLLVGGGFITFSGVKLNFIARLLGDQGGAVEFTSAGYSVDEAGGSASVAVQRTGSAVGSVSVNYVTSDGTASAGMDYVAQTGALVFGPGETNKTFNIPILPDALIEGNETVILTLGNLIGGVILGAQKTATLTILDNTNSTPPVFTSIMPTGADQVRLTLSGQSGRTYVLQTTTNFPNWISIQTNSPTSNVFDFFDSGVATSRQRFYRAFGQ
jgi:uncharacterized delta-60 repeat protein